MSISNNIEDNTIIWQIWAGFLFEARKGQTFLSLDTM